MKNKSQHVRLKRQLQCEFDGHSEGERRNERDADESERSESRAPPRHGETDRRGGETEDEAPESGAKGLEGGERRPCRLALPRVRKCQGVLEVEW